MKMRRIREWKFREVLVEKGMKNGMKMMMNSEGFIGLFGQNRGTPKCKARRDFVLQRLVTASFATVGR
jgi:hypothetical protein